MAEDFSNEGLYRLLEKMDREHGDDLREIRAQTTATNGNLIRHDGWLKRHDGEISDLKHARRPSTHEMKRSTDRTDAITLNIPINAKTIVAIIAAAITIAMAGWKAGLF